MGLSATIKEAVHLRRFLIELGVAKLSKNTATITIMSSITGSKILRITID